jgi:hypothetical protein
MMESLNSTILNPRPGSVLERILARLAAGDFDHDEPFPQDPSTGRPIDKTLCPDCFRLYDRECRTCGGDRHRDGRRGRVCPDCAAQRMVPVAIRGSRTGDLTVCGSCCDPKEDDQGRLIKTRGVPAYTYRRDREIERIAAWQAANPGRVRQVKHALLFSEATPDFRREAPYPIADPVDADLDLDDPSLPF